MPLRGFGLNLRALQPPLPWLLLHRPNREGQEHCGGLSTLAGVFYSSLPFLSLTLIKSAGHLGTKTLSRGTGATMVIES